MSWLKAGIAGALMLGLIALPVLAGLGQTFAMAAGQLPGQAASGLAPLQAVLARPGLSGALAVTLVSGIGGTVLALVLAFGLAMLAERFGLSLRGALAPILATPHAALAIGLGFLLAPSGFLARLISPWLTGWAQPPDLVTVGDGWGLALMLGLTIKELPFLLLVTLAALPQIPLRQRLADGRALGLSPGVIWVWVILPELYPRIRLSVFVALGFALSVVDMSLILGPSVPPSLAVWAVRLWTAPDLAQWAEGAALALAVGGLTLTAILAWLMAERVLGRLGLRLIKQGAPGRLGEAALIKAVQAAALGAVSLGLISLAVLALWSVAGLWRFPEAWPSSLTLRAWQGDWAEAAGATLSLALASSFIGLICAILWLEAEPGLPPQAKPAIDTLMLVPLLVPQIAFLPGLNMAFLRMGLTEAWLAVALAHLVFVLPYIMLVLAGPWRRLDPRYERDAVSLGLGPWQRLLRLRLPLLLAPILTAFAVGFAVSVAQFLPTLLMGGGRVATLTTEAVALASGGDRRLAATHALLQAILPILVFTLALLIPRWVWRKRRAMGIEVA